MKARAPWVTASPVRMVARELGDLGDFVSFGVMKDPRVSEV
jgi:hypothetical protein